MPWVDMSSRKASSIPVDGSIATTSFDDPGERQGEPTRPRPDVKPRLAGRRVCHVEEGREHRIVAPIRIDPEEPAHRGVEVGPVGHLADAVDLLPVGPDLLGPG